MDVSVIIVNYNTAQLLSDCLVSVKEKTQDLSYEVIVVDNASTDNSCELVRERFPETKLIESDINLGFGQANNRGAEEASGAYLFFLNSDTLLLNNAIKILYDFIRSEPDCGACGGNLTNMEGNPIHSYSKNFPSPWSDLYRFAPILKKVFYGKSWQYNYGKKNKSVAYITGADLFMPRSLFTSLGGFDKAFFMYYEETELCWRIKQAGHRMYSVPQARIAHVKGASLEFLDGSREQVFRSKYRYLVKLYGRSGGKKAHILFGLYCTIKRSALRLLGRKKSLNYVKRMQQLDNTVYHQELIDNA